NALIKAAATTAVTDTVYIKFALDNLPPSTTGADITKATLTLYASAITVPANASVTFEVHRINSQVTPWTETTLTNLNQPTLDPFVIDTVLLTVAQKKTYVVIDVTNLAKDWVDSVHANNGIALVPVTPMSGATTLKIDTKETTGTSHPATLDI